jgi:hypothetical protein
LTTLDGDAGATLTRLVVRSSENQNEQLDAVERWIFPPSSSEFLAETHGLFDGVEIRGPKAWDLITKRKGKIPEIAQQTVNSIDYLPDGVACSLIVSGLPFGWQTPNGPVKQEPFTCPWAMNKWYDAAPVMVRLQRSATPKAAIWDSGKRVLNVFAPKGKDFCLSLGNDISCHPSEIFTVALPSPNTEEKNTTRDFTTVCSAIATARGTSITPVTVLEIVHAIQKPLSSPAFISVDAKPPLTPVRKPGDTFVDFEGALSVSAPDSGTLEIEASWEDWRDNGKDNFWSNRWKKRERFGRTTITGTTDNIVIKPELRTNSTGDSANTDIMLLRHVVGDTRHYKVNYSPVSSSRYLECFKSTDKFESVGSPITVSIPNCGIPPIPKISYAVPVFSYSKGNRSANAIRVYLDRPWYETGEDELLGIVLALDANQRNSDFVSQWGQDPVHLSPSAIGDLDLGAFLNVAKKTDGTLREAAKLNLPLNSSEENENNSPDIQKVLVVPHDVRHDRTHSRWYSDIIIKNPAVYAPFVRLAVVRYQPNSLPGFEVSKAVKVDIVQLLPDRSVSIQVQGSSRIITVSGPDLMSAPERYEDLPRRVLELGFEWAEAAGTVIDEFQWKLHAIQSEVDTIFPGMMRLDYSDEVKGWHAKVSIPPNLESGSNIKRRIVLRELEIYKTDTGTGHRLVYAGALMLE